MHGEKTKTCTVNKTKSALQSTFFLDVIPAKNIKESILRDNCSILDTVLKYYLQRYFDDVTKGQIQKWQDSFNYKAYNDYVARKLDELGITVENRKRKFDHFVWYQNR